MLHILCAVIPEYEFVLHEHLPCQNHAPLQHAVRQKLAIQDWQRFANQYNFL